jgi:preprotein translocase subunit SecG
VVLVLQKKICQMGGGAGSAIFFGLLGGSAGSANFLAIFTIDAPSE